MIFVDTSVVVAASTLSDSRNDACIDRLAAAEARGGACAAHSLAEIFAILTGRPVPLKLSPTDAAQIVRHTSKRFTIITLTPTEYLATVQAVAELGHGGGMIYDALLLACARKCRATRIYTLNQKHFRLLAPDLASRIVEP